MEQSMNLGRRWMTPMLAEAAACKTRMPWERGLRRQAMITRRAAALAASQAAARAQAALTANTLRQTG